MNYKKIMILSLALLLSGCTSLTPQEEPQINETTVETNETEQEEIVEDDRPLSEELMKETLKIEKVSHFDSLSSNISLEKYNTKFSARPRHSVFVLNLNGNQYVGGRLEEIKAFNGDERVVLDSYHFRGTKSNNIVLLVFPEPITDEEFNEYTFETVMQMDNETLTLTLPAKNASSEIYRESELGGIFKIKEGIHGSMNFDNFNQIDETETTITYSAVFDLLLYGESPVISNTDIKGEFKSGDTVIPIESQSFIFVNEKDEAVNELTKTGNYKIIMLKQIPKGELDFDDIKVYFRIGGSKDIVMEVFYEKE